MEEKLEEENKNFRNFHASQISIIQKLAGNQVILSCFAGTGKTSILLGLGLWTVRERRQGRWGGSLIYLAPEQALAHRYIARLQGLSGCKQGLYTFGYSERENCDLLERDLREAARDLEPVLENTVLMLQSCLHVLLSRLQKFL